MDVGSKAESQTDPLRSTVGWFARNCTALANGMKNVATKRSKDGKCQELAMASNLRPNS